LWQQTQFILIVHLSNHLSVAMNQSSMASSPLELWAGVECTVNRVEDQYFDQLERNGHADRLDDLDRFAELGIRAIRYPVLWERVAPNGLEQADWSWTDQRLERLRELGICPIVGLVHHGSGPRHTNLIDPKFPDKLAEFAAAVSQRYPWVTHYTPVNEPLTTARFSGLYGHWYPHGRDDATFVCALLNECRGTIQAMQAIRQVNPAAQLVQTDDLGITLSTPLLAYQAEFENERRWLTFDLLCGRVDAQHSMWQYLQEAGIPQADLEWFLDHPCPPDVIGINYYLTSDRFLDERLERYPSGFHGGNGRHQYADVEALRVCEEGIAGIKQVLWRAWERYHLPLAVTEVHLGSTREEQLRWLKEAWDAAQHLHEEGVDVRAITAWALLGSYDWNTLVTRIANFYEPGVFDLRSPQPRPTALATMIRYLAQGQSYDHPLLDVPGWWRRDERLLYPPVQCQFYDNVPPHVLNYRSPMTASRVAACPVAIAGATGTLGQAFARICEIRGIPYCLLSRKEMDITDPESVERLLDVLKPWAVINATGYVRVDDAEREPELCRQINTEGAENLARSCVDRNIALVSFSSDLVFDGNRTDPYLESHDVAPLNVYGYTKAVAEQLVLRTHPCSLVVRTSAFFGPWDDYNFLTIALRTLATGQSFLADGDTVISPTYVPDLVNATLDLLIDGECGIWHLANPEAIKWADLAKRVAHRAGLDAARVEVCSLAGLGLLAPRPTYSVLSSERGMLLPELDKAINQYLQECKL
jgi:dTDP-4-dehydrorhamnose reductase